jgi:hypothetical protein
MTALPLLLLASVQASVLDLPPDAREIPMHAVHAALAGRAPALDPRILTPPPQLLERPGGPLPPFSDKPVYGGRMDNHVDSENFTVAWADGDASQAVAEQASEALELAWQVFVDEQGWTQPISSEQFLLWVVLDPGLSGTGLCTEYSSSEFPQGYPVIYLNPSYAHHPAFFDALATHEFGHALQFALRDWRSQGSEAWYWEASAEWMTEQARPELDTYAWSVTYYSDRPWYRYDSTEDYHHYGMCALNAYIEEHMGDADTLLSIWEQGGEMSGSPWLPILEASLGATPSEIWGGFTGHMSNELLAESGLYDPVLIDGSAQDGLEGEVAMLGTDYFSISEDATVSLQATVEGEELVLSGPRSWGDSIQLRAGDVVGVVGLSEPTAHYRLEIGPPEAWDTGEALDTEDDHGGNAGFGRDSKGCGCASPGHAMASWWLSCLWLTWLCWRRRSSA